MVVRSGPRGTEMVQAHVHVRPVSQILWNTAVVRKEAIKTKMGMVRKVRDSVLATPPILKMLPNFKRNKNQSK
jgi:hypothetical protein